MTVPSLTRTAAARALAGGEQSKALFDVTAQLNAGLAGRTASVVLYFASRHYDADVVSAALSAEFPDAELIGCSTAGEFTDVATGTGAISAIALPEGVIVRAAAGLGRLGDGAVAAVTEAVGQIEETLDCSLRDLDPLHYVGFVLVDGLHRDEEAVNEALGNVAPLLDFVGGSAGDDLAFESTWVAANGDVDHHGLALMVCEVSVPFHVVKTCSFVPSGRHLTITRADVDQRQVFEFDGRPAAEAYAAALGLPTDQLDVAAWSRHPLGLMIDGEPWIRSPQALRPDGSIVFFAQILEGMQVEVMNPTDLVADTATALATARQDLGGNVSGAVLFNCILRRLELDANNQSEAFTAALGGVPTAGFHTYGESWMGHINQTLTGVVFG